MKDINRFRFLTLAVGLFVALAATPALAAPVPDTSFIHGYDDQIRALVFGVEALDDSESACASLDPAAEGTSLTISENGETATVTPEVVEGEESLDASAEASDLCELTAIDVTGPNGQINHGTIVSSFVKALKAMDLPFSGKGCLVRHIAQSDYGKGDQQVKAGTDDEPVAEEPTEPVETVTSVMLEVDEASCVHGKADKGDEKPGKSGDEHGPKNKDDKERPGKGQENRPDNPGQGKKKGIK